ncbi:hypothetical protein SFA35_18275 [Pseudomonas sp. HR96]|uniref:hypothetical protein n=1 Tax=Pseudomonas sp. HR96 TaxID=1027966 RepID=UPI002A75E4EB|nr:hypothetical protein [Pseudomonas sp. HR96]WPO98566.1 hypothetical protein SFA35_18275 [Pseudomonas sp. HR96]
MNPQSPNIVKPLIMQPLVAPLLALALLLIGSGLLEMSVAPLAEGSLALVAAFAMQRKARNDLNRKPSPFVC